MFRSVLNVLVTAIVFTCAVISARAQCPSWRTFPSAPQGLYGNIYALQAHDDGTGPALYLGGNISFPTSSTPTVQYSVVRWNGTSFTPIGSPLSEQVKGFFSYNDGTGPALYAFGMKAGPIAERLQKWDGTAWSQVGPDFDGYIRQLAVHDDGTGPALYAGGSFGHIGGVLVPFVGKWTGSAWAPLGNGPGSYIADSVNVYSLASYDNGTGPVLYAGGVWSTPWPGNVGRHIAKWSAGAWTDVGTGTSAGVGALIPWNDGSGPVLLVSGGFTTPFVNMARWNGAAWSSFSGSPVPPGLPKLLNDGSGEKLYLVSSTGTFPQNTVTFKRWDGASWTVFSTTASAGCNAPAYQIRALASYDEGSGSRLFAATTPGTLGSIQSLLSRYNGSAWEPVASPPTGWNGPVHALEVHDDGSGTSLFAGGNFCQANGVNVSNIARFDGVNWHPVGVGRDFDVVDLVPYDWGSSKLLYAVGDGLWAGQPNTRLSRWNGTFWADLSTTSNMSDFFYAAQQFGQHMYVGGSFTQMYNGLITPNITRLTSSSGYEAVGTGTNGAVRALTTFDDGGGIALYLGGNFTMANGVAANRIVRFDGTNWTALGSGVDAPVTALVEFDDGTGPALYAGGTFSTAGGVTAVGVARWYGGTWSPLGAGLNDVLTLEVFDDGTGPALYAGGSFTTSGVAPVRRMARFDGANWSEVGGGTDGTVRSLRVYDGGSGPQLFTAGDFTLTGAQPSPYLAAWRGCIGAVSSFCSGDGTGTPCPCGNNGLANSGCANFNFASGANLSANGFAGASNGTDTLSLTASNVPGPGLFFQGDGQHAGGAGVPFGDGLLCASGLLTRMGVVFPAAGSATYPGGSSPNPIHIAGGPISAGDVRHYQCWYRDAAAFCSSSTFNLTQGLTIHWGP